MVTSTGGGFTPSRGRSVALAAGMVLIPLVLALGLSEIVLRAIGYQPSYFDATLFRPGPDSLLPYTLRQGYRGSYAGKTVTIDSAGYRVVAPRIRARPASWRHDSVPVVLLVGDSEVFGQGLGDSETIGSQLQDSLTALGLDVRVENIGVPGYNSWNEYAAIVEYLRRSRADHVVVIYVPNDPTFHNNALARDSSWLAGSGSEPLFWRAYHATIRHLYTVHLVGSQVRRLAWRFTDDREPAAVGSALPTPAEVDHSVTALARARDSCVGRAATFSVGIYRDLDYYHHPERTRAYEAMIGAALEREGIPWFPVASHVAHLTRNQASVAWNDAHSSARAGSYIVRDILQQLSLHQGSGPAAGAR